MIKYEEYKLMSDEEKLQVNEKNPIVINITKQEIKLNNTRKVDEVLNSLRNLTYKYKEDIILTKNKLFIGSVVIIVSGYINTYKELYEIPEVIKYFKELYKKYNYLFAYVNDTCVYINYCIFSDYITVKERNIINTSIQISNEPDLLRIMNDIETNSKDYIDNMIKNIGMTEIEIWNKVYLKNMIFIDDIDLEEKVLKDCDKIIKGLKNKNIDACNFIFDYDKKEKIYNIIPLFNRNIGSIILKVDNDLPIENICLISISGIPIDILKFNKYKYKRSIEDEWEDIDPDKLMDIFLYM